jgi:hypothetical protein
MLRREHVDADSGDRHSGRRVTVGAPPDMRGILAARSQGVGGALTRGARNVGGGEGSAGVWPV